MQLENYAADSSALMSGEKSKGSKCASKIEAKSAEISKSSDDIKKGIKDSIRPEDLKIGVNNMKKNDRVAITCNQKSEMKELRQQVEVKLGEICEVTEAKSRNPIIKVVGINENWNKDQLKEVILKQTKMKIFCFAPTNYSFNNPFLRAQRLANACQVDLFLIFIFSLK
ncbi:hypothetical protein WA026_018814 [Henosepilachna vigintioctopunctata]|uniref:Uncharacterized protein n=1 Tax=Henosepilachna vigintioctopunctata TaxID=420089 RepID=A0AAW1TQQ6_9CUCU